MQFIIKNNTANDILHNKTGINVPALAQVILDTSIKQQMFSDDQTFWLIGSGSFVFNDGSMDYLSPSSSWAALTDQLPTQVNVSSQPSPSAFAAKTITSNGVTKKLYKRITGIQSALVVGAQDIVFALGFPWAKINGIEIVGGEALDVISLFILDSTTGSYTSVPNAVLNQFGFTTNVAPAYYKSKSNFDADLYQGMQIKIAYISVSAKTIGINFDLNEVKS